MTDRVMIDIETLGLDPGAAILSIGAVKFDETGLGDEFAVSISLESCQGHGLAIDAGTLSWWLEQNEEAQQILTGGMPLKRGLTQLAEFYGDAAEVWAFSPSFDCAHLENAYDVVGVIPPWDYKQTRDCRTLASLPQWPEWEQEGTEHDALDDARYQAKQTVECLNRITGEHE